MGASPLPPIDPSSSTPGLRTLGSGAAQAVAGNDARFGRVAGPATLFAIGDSITANGYTVATNQVIAGQCWPKWAELLSNGRVRLLGIAATSGYTSAQIQATHLPTALASSAQIIAILAGTNDGDSAVTLANVQSMVTSIIAAGRTPLVCLLPPSSDSAAARVIRNRANLLLRRWCVANRVLLADSYTPLVDPATGGYSSGLGADSLHPLAPGARLIGQAVADLLAEYLAPATPALLAFDNTDATNYAATNPLFLTDGNADGLADGWTVVQTDGAGAVTPSLVTGDSTIKGSWQRFVKSSGTGYYTVKTASLAVSAGQTAGVYCRFKATSISSSNGRNSYGIRCQWIDDAFANHPKADIYLDEPCTGVLCSEAVIPAGVTSVHWRFGFWQGWGDVQIAQIALVNLSARGVPL